MKKTPPAERRLSTSQYRYCVHTGGHNQQPEEVVALLLNVVVGWRVGLLADRRVWSCPRSVAEIYSRINSVTVLLSFLNFQTGHR